jgi:asparagine synthase (glutamine-hydrolysing)
MASREETLFAGVRRLLPGAWMRMDRDTVQHGTIAWLDPSAEIRYRHESEYAEHLRDLLHVAVRARLTDAGRIGIELSGGVDSSTVAAIARSDLGVHAADRILLLSLVFPGLTCDERPFIEACHEAWRLPAYVVAAAGHEAGDTEDDSRHLDFPYHPNGAMCSGMRRYARAAGIRVIMTGVGGDEWFSGSRYHLADDFRRGRIWNAIRQAQVDGQFEPGPGALASLVTYGARPCAPAPIKALARRFRGAPSIHAPWIENAFAARANLAERLRVRPDAPAFPTLAQAEIFRGAIGGWAIHSAEMEARQARHLGIELRHPLADLRVARFALAIPETQRWSRRDRKHVLRAAAAGLVPDRVRLRGSKVDFTPVVVQALEAQGGAAFFRRLQTAALGWVNPAPLERMYGEMLSYDRAADPRCADTAWGLWMIAGIERWARAAGFVAVPRRRERATA